jgi:hypothetical protein
MVKAAADATEHEAALAASSVATAVAAAAAHVARTVFAADTAYEVEVAEAAQAVQDMSTVAAHRVAAETRWRAAGAAIAAKQAADALVARPTSSDG